MRISFGFKMGLAIFVLAVGSTTASVVYFYTQTRELVMSQMRNRLKDIAHTGTYLFKPEDRAIIRELDARVQELQDGPIDPQWVMEQDELDDPEDENYWRSLDPALEEEVHQTDEFQHIVQLLRQVKSASRDKPSVFGPFTQQPADYDDIPRVKYAYLVTPIPEDPNLDLIRILVDSDYQAVDMNQNDIIDDDETESPVGNLYIHDEQIFIDGLNGQVGASTEFYTDQWGTFLTGVAPILDQDGNTIAALGVDLDVKAEANRLQILQYELIGVIAVSAVLALLVSLILAKVLGRPIDRLRQGAERVRDRDFDTEVDVKSRDELGVLADTFNSMVRQIREHTRDLEAKVAQRTEELSKTLSDVQRLKKQQDGDYFLTSLLASPLMKNWNKSDHVITDFLVQQKKRFEFRARDGELGGDLCISGNLRLRNDRYTMFLNADAMGKSMQGAGGALVLGTVINSIMHRSAANDKVLDQSPQEWLGETYEEIHSVFKTFDGSMVISCILGLIHEQTGILYFFNAEHPFLILYRNGTASFVEEETRLSKVGLDLIQSGEYLQSFQLEDGDVLYCGSDGKDDLRMPDGTINEDPGIFLKALEKTRGDMSGLIDVLEEIGSLTDDLSLLRVAFHAAPVATESKEQDPMSQILEWVQDKEYEKALALLDEKGDRGSLAYHYYRGFCLYRLKRHEEALPELEKAADINQKHRAVPGLLGNVYYQLGKYDEAEQYYKEALEIDPDNDRIKKALEKVASVRS